MSAEAPRDGRALFHERLAAVRGQIEARLKPAGGDNPFRSLERRFIIAHAPRVGSHLLCEQLAAYGVRVEEYFEVPRIHAAAERRGLDDIGGYCRWLVETQASDGAFGVSGGVKVLAPFFLIGEMPDFAPEWSFVHLTRRDFVAQAVSELIARRTGAFKSTASARRPVTRADYDPARLKRLIDASMTVNAAWEGAFAELGVAPLRLAYEDLATDPAAVTGAVAAHLGLTGASAPDFAPKMRRQANAINEAWITRFRADHAPFCRSRAMGVFQPQQTRRAPAPIGEAP